MLAGDRPGGSCECRWKDWLPMKTLLQATATVALVTAGLGHPALADPAPAVQATTAPAVRQTVELKDGWRFHLGALDASAQAPDYADADWALVSVPHSWNRVGYYGPGTPGRINRAEDVNKVQGQGWYRLHFTAPKLAPGKRVWLEFDAASRIATVWLNGRRLGEHHGGYSCFRLDATDALIPGKANVLVVQADNSKPAPGSPTADVLPLAGDFFVPGGLYRPVRLVTTDALHFDMLDSGGPAVYATTRSIEGGRAQIDLSTRVVNAGKAGQTALVRLSLLDASGAVAAVTERPLHLAGGSESTAEATLALPAAHLWQGVDDPYLYTLRAEIVTRGGSVADRLDQRYGIRQFTIDPEKGFFLNGRPYPLRGVGYHQDNEAHGWAIQPADVEADVRTLREMGANSIRLTHYQHGATIHDLADRLGLIVWDEIPLVSQWTLGGAKTASDGLRANARQQLAELIAQNRNHASVAVWSIANEVDFGNSLPMFLTGGSGTPPDPAPLLAELGTLAKRLDPSRPTALATCCEGRLFGAGVDVPITATAVDVAGANRYFGWYYGKAPEVSENLDALRQKRPAQPLAVTEYGAGGAISIHTDNVLGGPVDSRGRNQPEEILDYVHEQNWAVLSRKPYLWATWIWAGFDFASTVRREGDADDINTKGMIDYDHQTRKDVFYFYKANWSKEPTVYVTGRHYRDRAYASTDVRVYSNAPETTLFVNDVRIGTRADCPEHVCTWPGIALREGANVVRAVGQFGASSVADSLTWQLGADAARVYRIDSGTLVAGPSANGRHGSDAFFEGGEAGTVVEPADYGKPQKPVVIAGTPDSAIAATYREGAFHYRMPVGPGRYRVSLTFIEPSARPGERRFDVLANGKPMLRKLDLAAAGAGRTTALERSFTVDLKAGGLDLWFRPLVGKAIVSALRVEPM